MPEITEVLKTLQNSANSGAEMLPVETQNRIIEVIKNKSWVRQVFADNTVPMSVDTLNVPKFTSQMSFYGVSDTATGEPTATSQATSEVTLSMKTIMGKVQVKRKLLAYGIPSLDARIESDIASTLAETESNMVINGDTTSGATNINGTLSTGDVRLEFDGLRKCNFDAVTAGSITNVNASGAVITLSHIRDAIKALGLQGGTRSDLILIVCLESQAEMLGWEELETLDKYGPNATIFTGEIGKIYGISVIATSKVPTNLNAAGKYDGVTTTRTVAILFNKRTPMLGTSTLPDRRFQMEVEVKPGLDQLNLFPREDIAFNVQWEEAIVQIYNLGT